MSVTLAELANHCQAELRGDPALQIHRVATLEAAGPRDIAFVAGDKYSAQLARTGAGAVILTGKDAGRFKGNVPRAIIHDCVWPRLSHYCTLRHRFQRVGMRRR